MTFDICVWHLTKTGILVRDRIPKYDEDYEDKYVEDNEDEYEEDYEDKYKEDYEDKYEDKYMDKYKESMRRRTSRKPFTQQPILFEAVTSGSHRHEMSAQ